jgi:hypothetical protein
MADPTSIRNASFGLLPTGYAPDEVDETLDQIATKIEAGEDPTQIIQDTSFSTVSIGYAPREVDEYLQQLINATDSQSVTPGSPRESDTDQSPSQETPLDAQAAPADGSVVQSSPLVESEFAGDDHVDEAQLDGPEAETVDDPQGSEPATLDDQPAPVAVSARPVTPPGGEVVSPDLGILENAAGRSADALGSLQGAIGDEISALRLALDQQVQETARHCETLLASAEADIHALRDAADTEIAQAHKAAASQIERDQRTSAEAIRTAHAQSDTEIAKARTQAEDELAAMRAEAERRRADAQQVIDSAIAMQSTIADSLQRAQQQLQPPADTNIAA